MEKLWLVRVYLLSGDIFFHHEEHEEHEGLVRGKS
jgi:hypothetical protein